MIVLKQVTVKSKQAEPSFFSTSFSICREDEEEEEEGKKQAKHHSATCFPFLVCVHDPTFPFPSKCEELQSAMESCGRETPIIKHIKIQDKAHIPQRTKGITPHPKNMPDGKRRSEQESRASCQREREVAITIFPWCIHQ